jgi:hypothetical protein
MLVFHFEEEEMKKFLMAVCVCLAVLTMVSTAFSEELWDWHLRGADEGLAAGHVPPPGLYFVNDFYWTGNWNHYDQNGNSDGIKLQGYVDVPILLWNPGICPILGATYACAIAQPFDVTNFRIAGDGPNGTQWGAYNTILVPFILSWEIPCNLHVAASFAVGLNDGTSSVGDSQAANTKIPGERFFDKNGNGFYAWSSNDTYTFTPTLGISWLYAGWNVSVEAQYTFWTKDTDINYQNGDQLAIDYTATYTCGKWTFGLGAEMENQVYNDKGYNENGVYAKLQGSEQRNITAGPIVGYNFGPCSLLFTYNFAISTTSDVGGDWAMLRLVVPLGNPCDWYK